MQRSARGCVRRFRLPQLARVERVAEAIPSSTKVNESVVKAMARLGAISIQG
jgi:hypothetical protein